MFTFHWFRNQDIIKVTDKKSIPQINPHFYKVGIENTAYQAFVRKVNQPWNLMTAYGRPKLIRSFEYTS